MTVENLANIVPGRIENIIKAMATGVVRMQPTDPASWTEESTNKWYATFSGRHPIAEVYLDSAKGQRVSDKSLLRTSADWWFDGANNKLYVYATADPTTTVTVRSYRKTMLYFNIKNRTSNTRNVWWTANGITPSSTTNSFVLEPGEETGWVPFDDAYAVQARAAITDSGKYFEMLIAAL